MLRTLALHLASLRARSGDARSEVHSLSDRVRALCEEIERQSPALAGRTPDPERADDLPTIRRTPRTPDD